MSGDTGGGVRTPPPGRPLPPQARELDQAITTLHTLITEHPARDPLTFTARALLDALTAVAQMHYPVTIPHRDGYRVVCTRCLHEPPVPTVEASRQVPWPCGTLRTLMAPLRAAVPPPPSPTGRPFPRPR